MPFGEKSKAGRWNDKQRAGECLSGEPAENLCLTGGATENNKKARVNKRGPADARGERENQKV